VLKALEAHREQIAAACARYGVLRLDVFGSAVLGTFRPGKSDIDFLVEFGPIDLHARVDAYFGLLEDLRRLLGTEVDLVMVDALKNRYIAAAVDRTRQAIYAA